MEQTTSITPNIEALRACFEKIQSRLNAAKIAYLNGTSLDGEEITYDALKRIAQETIEIYAPLAGRIGMQNIREELEDLAFAALDPEARESIVRRMEQHYPKTMIAKGLDYVPFAGLRSYDPAGAQFDIAQAHIANVREGYNETGWDQPRWINHISIRANDPAQVAEFYEKIFELKEAETYRDDGSICMTDGKVKLLLRPRDKSLYRGLREGLDHIGFKVEDPGIHCSCDTAGGRLE